MQENKSGCFFEHTVSSAVTALISQFDFAVIHEQFINLRVVHGMERDRGGQRSVDCVNPQ